LEPGGSEEVGPKEKRAKTAPTHEGFLANPVKKKGKEKSNQVGVGGGGNYVTGCPHANQSKKLGCQTECWKEEKQKGAQNTGCNGVARDIMDTKAIPARPETTEILRDENNPD